MKLTGDLAEVLNILGTEMEATAKNDSFVKVGEAKKDFEGWYTTTNDTIKVGRKNIATRFKQLKDNKKIKGKEEILATFIELHRSGSFCAHLSEQEITYFVKKKLNMESTKNG